MPSHYCARRSAGAQRSSQAAKDIKYLIRELSTRPDPFAQFQPARSRPEQNEKSASLRISGAISRGQRKPACSRPISRRDPITGRADFRANVQRFFSIAWVANGLSIFLLHVALRLGIEVIGP
jgi:hypothetical protein